MEDSGFSKLLKESRRAYESFLDRANKGIYLYGAGFIGSWAVGYFERMGIPVLGFVDSNEDKHGRVLAGKPIYGLAVLDRSLVDRIMITSRHAVPAIRRLLAHSESDPLSVDAFVACHEYPNKGKPMVELLSHDDKSICTFWAVLVSMVEGHTGALAPYADGKAFFGRFGFFNNDKEVFVDAGAYVGDTLERFIWSVNGVFTHIHAFEPGIQQYNALKRRVNRLCDEWALSKDTISLVNKALSSSHRNAYVATEGDLTGMSVQNNSNSPRSGKEQLVETVTLDSYFNGDRFTFLKVDVEGSERDVLEGASESIARHRPRIALSVYHYPTDIFELPLLVRQLNRDYLFYLGHHSSKLMETILYVRDKNE